MSLTLSYDYNAATQESFLQFESTEKLDAAGLCEKIIIFWKVLLWLSRIWWFSQRSWLAKHMMGPLWHNKHLPGSQPLKRCIPERDRTVFICSNAWLKYWWFGAWDASFQQDRRLENADWDAKNLQYGRTRTLNWTTYRWPFPALQALPNNSCDPSDDCFCELVKTSLRPTMNGDRLNTLGVLRTESRRTKALSLESQFTRNHQNRWIQLL